MGIWQMTTREDVINKSKKRVKIWTFKIVENDKLCM